MDRKEAVTILQEKRDLARMLEAAEKSADWAAKDRVDSSSLRASQHGRYADALDMAISALSPPNEWVSVEERLPTDERPVLVFVGYADTMTGFITTSSYFCFDANPHWQWDGLVQDEQKTLFWMPLPEPPGKEG